jgi:hypothetical protein
MRPGQNKRMRGRNNTNRKGPNPLTRAYESNGPDVKIRGTAHHVAEKYLQLARDAQSSGDPVMAESYLQHAEHYFRIIAAAQQAQQQAQVGYVRQPGEVDIDEDDDDDGGLPDRFASPPERTPPTPPPQPYQQPFAGSQPQPYAAGGFSGERQPERQGQPQGERQDRGPRPDRPYQDRNQDRNQNRQNQNRGPRDGRPPREFRNDQQQPQPQFRQESRPAEMRGPASGGEQPDPAALPAFITAPVRIPVNESETPQPVVASPAEAQHDAGSEGEGVGFHLRPRRRRRSRPAGEGEAGETPAHGEQPALD